MKNTTMACLLGASSHGSEDREQDDYYATHPEALHAFLGSYIDRDNEVLLRKVWEPANGGGHLTRVLRSDPWNRKVRTSDIVQREGGGTEKIFDFLNTSESPWDTLDILNRHDVVTNPPFKHAESFVRKGFERLAVGSRIILLLRLQFLESRSRYQFFRDFSPLYVYVHSARIEIAKNGDFKKYEKGGKAMAYAWFVWEVGNDCPDGTELRWISPFKKGGK